MNAKILTAVGMAASLFVAGIATTADASATKVSGTGWKTLTSVRAIDPKDTYTITFADSNSRTKLTKYAKVFAAQVKANTGVKIVVSTKIEKMPSKPNAAYPKADKHMLWGVTSKALAHDGNSYVYADTDWTSRGGYTLFRSSIFKSSVAYWKVANLVTHEGGHLLGLQHPNKVDSRGNVVPLKCPLHYSPARYPVMCSPYGGFYSNKNGGKFTYYDRIGLKQMVKNYG